MDSDERISREAAFLASLIAQKTSRFSLSRLEDAGLLLLEMAASRSAAIGGVPMIRALQTGITGFQRLASIVPPLTAQLAFGSTYLGMRAALLALRGASRILRALS